MKWERIERGSAGLIGVEVYTKKEAKRRYFVKIYVYDTVLKISGDFDTIKRKMEEILAAAEASLEAIEKYQYTHPEDN